MGPCELLSQNQSRWSCVAARKRGVFSHKAGEGEVTRILRQHTDDTSPVFRVATEAAHLSREVFAVFPGYSPGRLSPAGCDMRAKGFSLQCSVSHSLIGATS